jgi:hypothetical protein
MMRASEGIKFQPGGCPVLLTRLHFNGVPSNRFRRKGKVILDSVVQLQLNVKLYFAMMSVGSPAKYVLYSYLSYPSDPATLRALSKARRGVV